MEQPSFRTGYDYDELQQKVANLVWDPVGLAWVKMTQPGGANTATPLTPGTVAVSNSSGAAVASNASRKGLVITNVGSASVFLGLGVAAQVNYGIALYPNGTWEMDSFTFTTAAINAISGTSSTLAVQEFD